MMKRLVYILCAFALFAACERVNPDDQGGEGGGGGKVPAEYTISGVVSGADGTLLEGVVVSDGHDCTVTGADGKYYLNSDLSATDYVFVSTPSGWSAPVQDGFAVFWTFLKDCTKGANGKYSGVDFKLNKVADPSRFTMFIFADPQPRSRGAGYDKMAYHSLDCMDDMARDMKDLAATIKDRPVYGIALGDIVHQNLDLLPQYKKAMGTTGITAYSVIGNHDHGHRFMEDSEASKDYEAIMGPANYSFNLGGMHFLVLDNMISSDPATGKYCDECATGLTEDIWQWVQKDLAHVPVSTPLMVCAHSPMMRMQSGKDRSGAHLADLRGLISKYSKAYVWAGHTHSTFNYVDKSNPVLESHTVTRVTGALWTNEFLGSNGTPRGYLVFDCDGGSVKWKFKPIYWQTGTFMDSYGGSGTPPGYEWRDWNYDATGRAIMKDTGKPLDDSYQMQLFAPGTYGDKYVYANIFMWDEMWKTPVFTTDGLPSTMKRVTEKNYRYSWSDWNITLYYQQNNTHLVNEFIPDANNCDSMFRAYVEAEHGTGSVSVKDRFGNTYTSTITW